MNKTLNLLRVQGIKYLVEKVAVRKALVTNATLGIREVVTQLRKSVNDLRINDLDTQFRPSRDVPGWHVFLPERLFTLCKNVLNMLQPRCLQRRHQDPNYK